MGTPPPGYQQEWAKHTVHWHGFLDLSTVRGEYVDSPEFMLLGNPWILEIFPGDTQGNTLSSYRICQTSPLELILVSVSAMKMGNKWRTNSHSYKFTPVRDNDGISVRGWKKFVKRSKLMNSLIDGTLVIAVHMKLSVPVNLLHHPLYPRIRHRAKQFKVFSWMKNIPTLYSRLGEKREGKCHEGGQDCASYILSSSCHHRELLKDTC